MIAGRSWIFALLLALLLVGCEDDTGPRPGSLRFGQIGEIRLSLVVPLRFEEAEGELQQVLTWSSRGSWILREAISYRGLPGDQGLMSSPDGGGAHAAAYASLITQLNDAEGLKLFVDELPQDLDPDCPQGHTRIRLLIRDDIRNEEASWTRCTAGSLATLETSVAGPDDGALRVVQAAILMRDFTQGPQFTSQYFGSLPFGTLARAEDSGAEPVGPRTFISVPVGSSEPPLGWRQFWQDHSGNPAIKPPEVDWSREMVLVGAVGLRTEAGDSVEVRRVLQTGQGTLVELVERIPGNFCSPAAVRHHPIHVVVAPRTIPQIRFSDPAVERVPCGI